jgi:hypothetical protein
MRTYRVIQTIVTLHDTLAARAALDEVRARAGNECVTITPADDPAGVIVATISVAEELDVAEAHAIEQAIYALTPHMIGAAQVVTETDGASGSFFIGAPSAIHRLRTTLSTQSIVEWAMEVETPVLLDLLARLGQIVAARGTQAESTGKPPA